jgi:two-component system, OmpR family, phosphate regulon response regulator OmpR
MHGSLLFVLANRGISISLGPFSAIAISRVLQSGPHMCQRIAGHFHCNSLQYFFAFKAERYRLCWGMSLNPKIIVVDDDPEMRALVQRFLGEHGYSVKTASDGAMMDKLLAREAAQAIVLDLMMPGEDGLAICRRLRAAGDDTPILMLTAKGDPVDRILGLEMGADDYLPKPFMPRELVARLSAILRRTSPRATPGARNIVQFGPFTLDPVEMSLERDGQLMDLSSREIKLLIALASSRGRTLSRAQLIDRALGSEAEVTDRAIDVQINRLRKALGEDPDNPKWIKTVWGAGYVLASA